MPGVDELAEKAVGLDVASVGAEPSTIDVIVKDHTEKRPPALSVLVPHVNRN
jgi:hypothetical protein